MDHHVAFATIADAFGVPATVTVPGGEAVATTAVWVPMVTEEYPNPGDRRRSGGDFQKSAPRRVISIDRVAVPSLPLESIIVAPEALGEDDQTWRVDGLVSIERDATRVVVVAVG